MSETAFAGTFKKNTRLNITKIRVQSLKPPLEPIEADGKARFQIVYVSDGRENRVEATQELWREIMGPKAKPGRKVPGLDNQVNEEFYLCFDKDTKIATSIDRIPKNQFEKGLVPEDLQGVELMKLQVRPNGSFILQQLPAKVRSGKIKQILDELDKVDTLVPGDMIAGCEIISASGNLIELDPRGDD